MFYLMIKYKNLVFLSLLLLFGAIFSFLAFCLTYALTLTYLSYTLPPYEYSYFLETQWLYQVFVNNIDSIFLEIIIFINHIPTPFLILFYAIILLNLFIIGENLYEENYFLLRIFYQIVIYGEELNQHGLICLYEYICEKRVIICFYAFFYIPIFFFTPYEVGIPSIMVMYFVACHYSLFFYFFKDMCIFSYELLFFIIIIFCLYHYAMYSIYFEYSCGIMSTLKFLIFPYAVLLVSYSLYNRDTISDLRYMFKHFPTHIFVIVLLFLLMDITGKFSILLNIVFCHYIIYFVVLKTLYKNKFNDLNSTEYKFNLHFSLFTESIIFILFIILVYHLYYLSGVVSSNWFIEYSITVVISLCLYW